MKLIRLTIFIVFTCQFISLQAQERYWQQKVDYKMDVTLDPNENTLQAFARITYTNNSPDTLRFIWFHLWPNAYRNDRTAFSDQLLENGITDFYFSDDEQKGYINRLDFRIDEKPVSVEDHPEHIDIVKLILPQPLQPGASVVISTPFHVKLPYNFSRSGFTGKTYQVTQWYPKPAVYDSKGWHPMPYLDQGEFYSDFGDYEVNITVPEKFIVAASGEPLFKVEDALFIPKREPKKKRASKKTPPHPPFDWNTINKKSYSFRQNNVIDFAWFADTTFTVQQDSITLASGRIIQLRCYFHLNSIDIWANAVNYMKEAIRYHSEWIGEYPYDNVTVVDGSQGFQGGMEYPTITILNWAPSPKELDLMIFHELGHNWFQASLATNERKFPWMDEGMNTYYDNRYEAMKYPYNRKRKGINAMLEDPRVPELFLRTQVAIKKDQSMTTPSDSLTVDNYDLIAYTKAGLWMKKLEQTLGQSAFDSAMQEYYQKWKFKHPYPEDFQKIIQSENGAVTDTLFTMLHTKGNINPEPSPPLKFVPLYKLKETYTSRPIFVTPIVNYNTFNGIMPGLALHNYSLPLPRLNFVVAPMYGIKSKKMNGWGRVAYHWYPLGLFSHIEASTIVSVFNQKIFEDSLGMPFSLAYKKISPSVKFTFKEPFARSTVERFLQFKYFFINEDDIRYIEDPNGGSEIAEKKNNRYNILQTRFVYDNYRKLYPYRNEVMLETNKDFIRLDVTSNYFFNFKKKGGVNVRFFAGKFFYLSGKNLNTEFEFERFNYTMTGPKGDEDYTYSAPFIGRNETSGFWSQQIMVRDGNFKVRADLLADKIGKSDDWLTSFNVTVDVPDKLNILQVLPIKIPLKLFMDVGASGSTWNKDSEGSRLLYDAGFQISMLNNIVNFYFPLLYSSVYDQYYKSTPGNNFWQRVSFSINIQDLTFRQIRQFLK
jgi:hypothetical protein